MGEAFGGFSIREHALKTRSVDVVKCYPFISDSDKMSKEDMAAMLPPMAVTKFRYWRDELEAMKKRQQPNKDMLENSTGWELDEQQDDVDKLEVCLDNLDDKSDDELVCPVCKIFTAATVNAMNAHIDSCLAQTSKKSMKGKSRPPKKRSIAEIFAETPQIDKTEAEQDARFGHGKGFAASNAKSSLKMNRRKMFKKKRPKVRTTTTKKKTKELKPCSLPKSSKEVCHTSCHRRSTLEISNAAPLKIKKTKPKPKFLKKTCTQSFKLIAKKQDTKLSACGILKNCRNVTEQSSSTICNRSGSDNNHSPSSQQLIRHVRFSDARGALKHQEECLTELNAVESIRDDNALSIMEKEAEAQQVREKRLLYGTHDQGRFNHLPGELVAPSQTAVHDGRYTVPCEGIHDSSECNLYVGNPRFHSSPDEEHHYNISTQAGSSAARFPSSSEKLTDHSEDQAPGMAAKSSLAGGSAYLQHSLSSFPLDENQNGRLSHLSQFRTGNISGRPMGLQSHFNPPSIQLIDNFSNHQEWMPNKLRFEEGYNHGNYCGLPLNSQGELIQMGSGSYSGHNHPLPSNTVSGSSSTLPFHRCYVPSRTGNYVNERTNCSRMIQKDQLNLFPMRGYVKENLEVEFPSRSSIANVGISGRADVIYPESERRRQMGCVLGSDQSSLNMCYQGCDREYDQTTNQRGKGMIQLHNHDRNTLNNPQPTMRLMGKDVAIGQNNKETTYLEEGKCLADKEFFMDYHPTISTQNDYLEKSSFMENCSSHAGAGRIREPVPDFLQIQNSQPLDSSSMMRYPEPTWETNSGLGGYPSSEQYFFTDPPTPAMFTQAKNFREQFGPVTDFLSASSQSSLVPSTFQDTCQHMQSRCGLKQSLAKARESVFDFPFLHPDNGVNFQQFWLQNSKSLPQLSHPAQQNQSSHCPQAYSDIVCKGHPPSTFGICIPSGQEIRHQAGAYDPHNSMISHMLMTISPFPESAAHHPFVPILPSANATSATEPKDMKLKAAMSDSYQRIESRKRPANGGYNSMRPFKMLNINAQERSRALENYRTGITGCKEIPVDLCVHDFTFYRSQTGNAEPNSGVTPKDLLGNPFFIDGSKSAANTNSGTVKLSAGANHTMKPSHNVDQDKFTSIHSTVPLSPVTYSDSVMKWQKSTRNFQP